MPVAKPESSDSKIIAHIDMDCFYVQGTNSLSLFLCVYLRVSLFVPTWGFLRIWESCKRIPSYAISEITQFQNIPKRVLLFYYTLVLYYIVSFVWRISKNKTTYNVVVLLLQRSELFIFQNLAVCIIWTCLYSSVQCIAVCRCFRIWLKISMKEKTRRNYVCVPFLFLSFFNCLYWWLSRNLVVCNAPCQG